MVDIDTALRSAAIDGRKAKRQSDDSKPRRAGGSVGLEPFDPSEFKKKRNSRYLFYVVGHYWFGYIGIGNEIFRYA